MPKAATESAFLLEEHLGGMVFKLRSLTALLQNPLEILAFLSHMSPQTFKLTREECPHDPIYQLPEQWNLGTHVHLRRKQCTGPSWLYDENSFCA